MGKKKSSPKKKRSYLDQISHILDSYHGKLEEVCSKDGRLKTIFSIGGRMYSVVVKHDLTDTSSLLPEKIVVKIRREINSVFIHIIEDVMTVDTRGKRWLILVDIENMPTNERCISVIKMVDKMNTDIDTKIVMSKGNPQLKIDHLHAIDYIVPTNEKDAADIGIIVEATKFHTDNDDNHVLIVTNDHFGRVTSSILERCYTVRTVEECVGFIRDHSTSQIMS